MEKAAKDFLIELVSTPGVSGYEQPVQKVVRKYAESFAEEINTDLHGNVTLSVNSSAETRVMLAGHCDQIGLIVSHIDDNGFIYTQTIGGWDPQQLIGQRMTVWTSQGPINGVIARKAIHLLDPEERKQVVKAKELWIDIGASNKEEASDIVEIGDSVTLQLGFQPLLNNLANSPAMDNRTGLWVCVEALRRAAASKKLNCNLFAVSTVQEEIGLRGARTADTESTRTSGSPSTLRMQPTARPLTQNNRGTSNSVVVRSWFVVRTSIQKSPSGSRRWANRTTSHSNVTRLAVPHRTIQMRCKSPEAGSQREFWRFPTVTCTAP